MRRGTVLAGLTLLATASSYTIAEAATPPVKGEWNSAKASFSVNAAGTKIIGLRAKKCPGPVGFDMKIKKNGRFSLKRKLSFEGGGAVKLSIKGRFTSPTKVKGTFKFGSCKSKFSAAPLPVEIEPPEDPEPEPEPEPDPEY